MISVNLGRTNEELNSMKDQLKEFRDSPLGRWFMLNLEVWKQKINAKQDLSGDHYRGIMSTLMEIQLQFAVNGKIESEVKRRTETKEVGSIDDLLDKQKFKEKVLKI